MLKLVKLDKYYNRHKKNQLHVINNTSLELEDKGLVAFLGPSGCGKTTLLNAIGGLDKVNKGKIYINGKRMPNRGSLKKDKMRVLNIGYIFQNYNLLDNLSVYDNVAMSLKMVGIKNKNEIKKRVDYVLESVDMYRYRNKLAGALSGGQRQRVGIARAIVKNPSVIIADEPTGNLDSKNTIEIMNIIKSISQNRLVILVTHEKDLALFYASRIVSLEDGRIIDDKENIHESELDYRIDNQIYLKDFKNKEKLKDTNHQICFYSDDNEKVDLDIVVKNGNIFIRNNNQSRIELVDENSSFEFLDEHYKKITSSDYEKSNFDLSKLDNSKRKLKYTSIYNIFTMLSAGVKKVFSYTVMKKILLVGFFISAMFIVYAVSNIFGSLDIKDEKFMTKNREYIIINNKKNKVNDYLALENDEHIGYMIPGDSEITISSNLGDKIYQFRNANVSLSGSLASLELVDNVICGTKGTEPTHIVVDKMVLDRVLKDSTFEMVNIKTYEDIIGLKFNIPNLGDFTITGVSDTSSPSIYMNESIFTNLLINTLRDEDDEEVKITDYNLIDYSDIILKKGRLPENDYEVIVNISNQDMMPLYKYIDYKVNGKKLKVVGYYYSKEGKNNYFVNNNTIKYYNISKNANIIVYSPDKKNTIEYLQSIGLNAIDSYEKDKRDYTKSVKESIKEHLIVAGILLLISFIEIFLMIRASFLSRIKEVGIYRAIGTKKTDIYKMFLGEILVITTLASVPGFILMTAILREIIKIDLLKSLFMVNIPVLTLSLIIIYSLNIIMGLMPIRRVVKKTPAEILSRVDVD